MTFQLIEFIGKPTETKASISYRRFEGKAGRVGLPKLTIGIPKSVALNFNPTGKTYGFFVGEGEHKGKALIRSHIVGTTARVVKGGVTFRFGYSPYLGNEAAERSAIDCRADDHGGFEIDLPPWFKPPERTLSVEQRKPAPHVSKVPKPKK